MNTNNALSVYDQNTPMISSENLTQNAVATPGVASSVGGDLGLRPFENPYPPAEMEKVLSRKYRIADVQWNDMQAAGTVLDEIDLMDLLVNVPNIRDKLSQFRWLAADMQVEVRINSTPFHIGSVVVSHLPRTLVSNYAGSMHALKSQTLAQRLQARASILTASSVNNCEMMIHREASSVFDPVDAADAYVGCMGLLAITVLNPLTLATEGSVNPVTISIFANFVNPRPAGYGYFPINAPEVVQPQGDVITNESKARASSSVLGPEGSSLYPSQVIQGADMVTKAMDLGTEIAQFAGGLGFCKPPNQSTLVPAVIDDFRDINYVAGVSQPTKFAGHPAAGLGDSKTSFLKKTRLTEVIGHPGYVYSTTFDKNTPPDQPFVHIPVHPSLSNFSTVAGTDLITPTHLAYACQAFRYWRGSMKFMFHFVTSQFVSARVRITFWPSEQLPASIEAYAGDAVSTIVDIRGETWVPFSAKYVAPAMYQPCRGYIHAQTISGWNALPVPELNGFISVSLVNPLQQPDYAGTAAVYMNIFTCAGDDFVLGNMVRPFVRAPVAVPPEGKVKPQSLVEKFSRPFDSFVPSTHAVEKGVVLPEQFTTVEETLMKYTQSTLTPLTNANLYLPLSQALAGNTAINNPYTDALTFWAPLFRWYRGSLRYKLLVQPSTAAQVEANPFARYVMVGLNDIAQPGDPPETAYSFQAVCDSNLRSVAEFELPWLFSGPCASWWADEVAIDEEMQKLFYAAAVTKGDGNFDAAFVYRSVGDDFMFGSILPTPTRVVTPSMVATKPAAKVDQTLVRAPEKVRAAPAIF